MSSIDDVEFDVDIDGEGGTVATLILHGDFTTACEDYLENNTGQLRLAIGRNTAEELVRVVNAYL